MGVLRCMWCPSGLIGGTGRTGRRRRGDTPSAARRRPAPARAGRSWPSASRGTRGRSGRSSSSRRRARRRPPTRCPPARPPALAAPDRRLALRRHDGQLADALEHLAAAPPRSRLPTRGRPSRRPRGPTATVYGARGRTANEASRSVAPTRAATPAARDHEVVARAAERSRHARHPRAGRGAEAARGERDRDRRAVQQAARRAAERDRARAPPDGDEPATIRLALVLLGQLEQAGRRRARMVDERRDGDVVGQPLARAGQRVLGRAIERAPGTRRRRAPGSAATTSARRRTPAGRRRADRASMPARWSTARPRPSGA